MTFFNKKEEILELKLTSFGKQKLASGKFKPVYYAFFDDDILYDAARAGVSEDNNDIEPRIQEQSPSLRAQTSFSDLEQKVRKQTYEVSGGISRDSTVGNLNNDPSIFQDQDGLRNVLPLGNSQMGNQYTAAWRVQNLTSEFGTIRATTNDDPNKKVIVNIPQLGMDMIVKPTILEKSFIGVVDPKTDKFVVENEGHFIRIEDDTVLLDIAENNVDLLNDAFSLEIYEVKTEDEKEVLKPKMFKKRTEDIIDGILLDDAEIEAQVNLTPVDERFVEFYFDITTDNDIDEKTKSDVINKRVKKGSIFDKSFTPESIEQVPGARLYTTDNNGEDC